MGGKHDSTKTRVSPLMKEIGKDKNKINLLFSLLPKIKPIKNDEKILEICFGENEKGLCPKQSLLEWLVNNTDKLIHLANYGSTNKTTQENRKQLFNGSETKKNEALNLIRSNPEKTKEWYIFEGYSKPDIYIETTSSIYIAEAKRTEPRLTTSTQWLDPRDQSIRHADSIIDGEKKVYYFFIIDEEKINSYELTRYEDLDYYEKNLPHRNKKEDFQKFRDSYCGYTTWTKISNILKIKFPDTINEL